MHHYHYGGDEQSAAPTIMDAYAKSGCGWAFTNTADLVKSLPAGAYRATYDSKHGVTLADIPGWDSDAPIDLPIPEAMAARTLAAHFFTGTYRANLARMQVGERLAFLLRGEHGTGKSQCLRQITDSAIRAGWVVVFGWSEETMDALRAIRQVEPERGIVLVIEELDNALKKAGSDDFPHDFDAENTLLQLLDGKDAMQRLLVLMTTNHLSRIPARLFARARRITNQYHFGKPTAAVRRAYFEHLFKLAGVWGEGMTAQATPEVRTLGYDAGKWAERTRGLNLDQCAALVVAVAGYEESFADVCRDFQERKRALANGDDTAPDPEDG